MRTLPISKTERIITGWGIINALVTDIVLHPEEFSAVAKVMGYELMLSFHFLESERRYQEWRSVWDTTEEQDYAYGYASL